MFRVKCPTCDQDLTEAIGRELKGNLPRLEV
jgi:hypothetical protein